MMKKLIAAAVAWVVMFALVLPAQALQVGEPRAVRIASSGSTVVDVGYEGTLFYQGTGVTWIYDLDNLKEHSYAQDSHIAIESISGAGSVRWEPVAADDGERYSITAQQSGEVTVNCVETWMDYDDSWDPESWDWVESAIPQSEMRSFTINVVGLDNLSGALTGCITDGGSSHTFTFKLRDLPELADVRWVSDSSKKGNSWIQAIEKGQVKLTVYGVGTHNIKLEAYGKTITCKAILRTLSLKKTADVKDTGSLVTYPGKKSKLAIALTGVKNPKATWTSTNPKIVKVTKKGVAKAHKKGRCYLKAKIDGATVKVLAEVTSKPAYQAVCNAYADFRTKLTYSQPNRMTRMSRDCSSFVSRCYWDASLGRRIFIIGDAGAAQWAYTAAGQAQWLNSHGKRVAWKACSVKKLRPGDTVYFETDYAGKDASQWRYIDHAGMYVGNGLILNTSSAGGKGTVGYRWYSKQDTSIKFIGRPCP